MALENLRGVSIGYLKIFLQKVEKSKTGRFTVHDKNASIEVLAFSLFAFSRVISRHLSYY